MTFFEKIENCLAKFIKGGIFLILFLPLIMDSSFFFPFIVPRNIIFRIAVELIFAAYIILASFDPAYRPRFNKLVWSVLAFFGITAVATFLGINIYTSVWSNYERMGGLIHYLHLALYFFVLFNVFKRKNDWHSFFTFSIFTSILVCFVTYAQWLDLPFIMKSGGTRLSATLGNAIYLAAYLIFNLFFVFYFIAKEKRFDIKTFCLAFLTFDIFLVTSSVFSRLFSAADWGSFEILKNSMLIDAAKYGNFFGVYFISQALVFGSWFMRGRRYAITVLLCLIAGFQFAAFWQTQTRGAVIGLFLGFMLLAVMSFFSFENKKIKYVLGGCFILLIIAPFFLVSAKNLTLVKNSAMLSRLAGISATDITTESRLTTWQASWRGWTETPKSFLIGYGPENYFYVFNKYFPTVIYRDAGSQIWFDRPHNIVFDIATTTGAIGLISYLTVLGMAIFFLAAIYRRQREISSSWLFVALILAYFVQNLFVFDMLNTEILFYLLLAFIAFGYQKFSAAEPPSASEEEPPSRPAAGNASYIILAITLILLLFGLSVNFNIVKANKLLIAALTSNNLEEKIDYFKASIQASPIGHFEARQQLGQLAVEVARNDKVPAQVAKSVINYATDELEKSIKEEPLNIRQRLWMAMVYNNTVNYEENAPKKAIGVLEDYIYLSPTRPHIYFELGQSYAILGNNDKAISYFKQGVELAPKVMDSRWLAMTLYVMLGRNDLADAEFKDWETIGWKPNIADYTRLIELYGRVKNYDKMIEFGQKMISLQATPDNYAQLAIIYARAGKNDKAKEAANEAVELNPAAAESAKDFIKKVETGEFLDK